MISGSSTDRQEIGKGNLVACGEIGCDVEGRWKAMFSKKVYEDDRPDAVFSWRYTCIGCYAAIHNMTEQEAIVLFAFLGLILLTLVWWFLLFRSAPLPPYLSAAASFPSASSSFSLRCCRLLLS